MSEEANFENGGLESGPGNPYPDPGVAAQGHQSHESGRPVHEIFGDKLVSMSAREIRSLTERHLRMADIVDGSSRGQ